MDRANHGVRDAQNVTTLALPGSATTVYTSGLNLGLVGDRGARLEDYELQIKAPVLTTSELPDTQTLKYDIQHDSDPAFGTAATIAATILTQTGAGGAGAAAANVRFRVPSTCKRYVRAACTKSGAGSAATASMTFEVLH